MNKRIKIITISAISLVVLLIALIIGIKFLPQGEVEPEKEVSYVSVGKSEVTKISIDNKIKEFSDEFVAKFFTFDVSKMENGTQYTSGYSAMEKYNKTYGKGSEIKYNIVSASSNSKSAILTYDVTGIYGSKENKFSLVLKVSTENDTMTVTGITVVENEK